MKANVNFCPYLCLVILVTFGCQPRSQKTDSKIHALLVGVTVYPNLSRKNYLIGPAKDVVLMSETIKYLHQDASITVLSESGGRYLLPSFENIQREFHRLANELTADDQLLVLLAGHGDRNPNDNPSVDPEVDGMDEVFLPRDAAIKSKVIVNAISDDQLNQWLTNIRHTGASVLFISDSCHSDTQTRAIEKDDPHQGARSRGLNLLRDVAAHGSGVGHRRDVKGSELDLGQKPGKLIAFFAAQADEETPDRFRAPGANQREHQGLLTYTICKIVKAHPGITYRELGQRIQQQYQVYRNTPDFGATVPHPSWAGIGLDQIVLGNERNTSTSRLTFTATQEIRINGGAIDGLTNGSILRLQPAVGAGDQTLGWAVLDRVNLRDSVASLVDYQPESKTWTNRLGIQKSVTTGRCAVESVQYEGLKLRVALDRPVSSQLNKRPYADFTEIARELETESKKQTSPFELTELEEAEFVLGVNDALEPNGFSHLVLNIKPEESEFSRLSSFHLGPIDGDTVKRITNRFQRVSRAKRLVDVARRFRGNRSASGDPVRFVLAAEIADHPNGDYEELDMDRRTIPRGKFIRFRIRNYSSQTIQATLLYVGDDYRIDPVFPNEWDSINDVPPMKDGTPGEKLVDLGADLPIASHLPESVVALATFKSPLGENSDYSYLQQPPLEIVRDGRPMEFPGAERSPWPIDAKTRGQSSALTYLHELGFCPGATRNVRASEMPPHAFSVVTWRVIEPATE